MSSDYVLRDSSAMESAQIINARLRQENAALKDKLQKAREGLKEIAKHPACHKYTGRIHESPSPFKTDHESDYALGIEDGHRCCSQLATQTLKEIADDE